MNLEIRAKEVRVIGPEGEQLGIMSARDGIKKAEEYSFDLVEVAPTSNPPVCRIMDFGKYKYELSKKEHSTKQKGTQIKEVKFRLYTGNHDVEFKIRHAKDFLEEGHKVKITLMFRGREMAYQQKGREIMAQIQQQLLEIGLPEYPPKMEGNSMVMILVPKATKEHTQKENATKEHPTKETKETKGA